jgi:fumarate hydratase class II
MMPIIAHDLFEMMQVTIGSVRAFTERCVRGLRANRAKAEGWLERNAIIATALNPLIGYRSAAELVKEALEREASIREVAAEWAARGELRHKDAPERLVTMADVDKILGNLREMTEGGILASGKGG